MDNTRMVIETDSVRALANTLINEATELIGMVNTARSEIEGTKDIYDSPSAVTFRNKMNEYANNAAKGIEESFQALSDAFATVAQVSDTTEAQIASEAEKYLSSELFETVE